VKSKPHTAEHRLAPAEQSDTIGAIVVNFQTPDLLVVAVESFRRFYPKIPLIVVDNGSRDRSRHVVMELEEQWPRVTLPLLLEENVHHGPALHRALQMASQDHIYIFDSDTIAMRGGFLEEMATILEEDPVAYAVGLADSSNKRGFLTPGGVPFTRTAYMMIRRSMYLDLPPFVHHGQPTLANFTGAAGRGYAVRSFPIETYVKHLGRGTASRFGYGLGIRSKLDYVLNKLGL